MVYITGDCHGECGIIVNSLLHYHIQPSAEDTLVILGDVGANFFQNSPKPWRHYADKAFKMQLNGIGCHVLCIHGNHEQRPEHIHTYKENTWCGGVCWEEEAYPFLHFAKDGEIYELEGQKCLVIGGAYSVDKEQRLANYPWTWFSDEQPNQKIRARVEDVLRKCNNTVDVVFSHTCPEKYEPVEAFMPGLDQSAIDRSTEVWLGKIEADLEYLAWYCGHWHINKRIDKMHFLFHDIETLDGLNREE